MYDHNICDTKINNFLCCKSKDLENELGFNEENSTQRARSFELKNEEFGSKREARVIERPKEVAVLSANPLNGRLRLWGYFLV